MSRALAALLGAIAAAGCGGGVVAGEAHFEDLTTETLPLRVRITNVVGDWAQLALLAEIEAPGAAWAAMDVAPSEAGYGPPTGPARRTIDGAAQLERGAEWFSPDRCEGAVCEIELVLRLDAPPSEPWRASVFATVDGETDGPATIEIEPR